MFRGAPGNDEPADANIIPGQNPQTSREVEGLRRLRGHKSVPHGFRDTLRAVMGAALIITTGANVDVLVGRQAQASHGPATAGNRPVTEERVAHVVGRRLEGNAGEL